MLATYGVTRHVVTRDLAQRNSRIIDDYALTEAEALRVKRRQVGLTAFDLRLPFRLAGLQRDIVAAGGRDQYQDGMVVCLAGAAMLLAVAAYLGQPRPGRRSGGVTE